MSKDILSGKYFDYLRYPELTILLLLVLLVPAQSVPGGTPTVSPGGVFQISEPVDGGIACFIGRASSNCMQPRWQSGNLGGTSYSVAKRQIMGEFSPEVFVGLGVENRAIAFLDYEFFVTESSSLPGGFVDTEIAVIFDLESSTVASGAYSTNTIMSMTLSDVTGTERFVSGATLFDSNRQGDQGVTDISTGSEHHLFGEEVFSLPVLLRRGRSYRLRVAVQGSGSMLVLGHVGAALSAFIRHIRVHVDEDSDEFMRLHNAAVRSDIETHDEMISAQLAAHDEDIKALLGDLKETVEENQRLLKIQMSRQLEIMRHMITPNGRREIDEGVLTCTGNDCPVYPDFQFCKNGSRSWNCGR